MLSRFHTIPACHGRTDGQTDGQTDKIAISISRVSSSMLTRDKNLTDPVRPGHVRHKGSQYLLISTIVIIMFVSINVSQLCFKYANNATN